MCRPPGSEPRVLRELLKSIQRAKDRIELGEFKSLILCGDFNLPKVTGQNQTVGSIIEVRKKRNF